MGGSNPGPAAELWLTELGAAAKSHSAECLTQLRHDGRASSHLSRLDAGDKLRRHLRRPGLPDYTTERTRYLEGWRYSFVP